MKLRLLDILACPNDKHFPLELKAHSTIQAPGKPVACELYCARRGAAVESGPPDPAECDECAATSVADGELHCPACGRAFKIEEGMPRLLPDHPGGDSPVGRDKANEMLARDNQAADYDNLKMLRLISKLEVPKVVRFLDAGPGDVVVELGAGTGRVTPAVANRAGELVAIDFSLASLKRSRAKFAGANTHWVQGDVNHLPLRDLAADHAFSCQVFEHLPGAAQRNMAVDEAARVIKGAGTFVISVYRDSWVWRLFGEKEGYHPGGIYYCRLTGNEFGELLGRRFTVKKIVPNLGLYLQLAKCQKTP